MNIFVIKKNNAIFVTIIFVLLFSFSTFSQVQKIAYIDSDYIMSNIPEHKEAEMQIEKAIRNWQSQIEQKKNEIKSLESKLNMDKVLLTQELIDERKFEINELIKALEEFQRDIFGENGKLILKRQSLMKPIQDQLWNVVNEISSMRRYAFVFDKADILMIYSDKKFDISDQVLKKMNIKLKNDK